jgi:hypothetical protein
MERGESVPTPARVPSHTWSTRAGGVVPARLCDRTRYGTTGVQGWETCWCFVCGRCPWPYGSDGYTRVPRTSSASRGESSPLMTLRWETTDGRV